MPPCPNYIASAYVSTCDYVLVAWNGWHNRAIICAQNLSNGIHLAETNSADLAALPVFHQYPNGGAEKSMAKCTISTARSNVVAHSMVKYSVPSGTFRCDIAARTNTAATASITNAATAGSW